jgi:chromosome partitioning protein
LLLISLYFSKTILKRTLRKDMIGNINFEPRQIMRSFDGVKAKLAMELTGFTGTPKTFRARYRDSTDNSHKLYSAQEIRHIRMDLLGIPQDTTRSRSLPPIIDTRMAKGGVGKTTITGNVASCLALSGYKVLLIDGDPQASLTSLFGINWLEEEITHVSKLMQRAARNEPANPEQAVRSVYPGGMLDLIPSDITMVDDTWLMGIMNREFAFQRLLEQELEFFSKYDVIVIDSAPGASLLSTTFMVASKTLLTVVSPEGQAIAALDVLASNVQEINAAFNRQGINLDVHIVVNQYNQTKKPHNFSLSKLLAKYPDKINDTIVRDFVGFLRETDPDSIHTNGPVLEKEPNSGGARDIIDLTKSLTRLYSIRLAGAGPAAQLEEAA